ncbi:MAG: endonuclease [Chitinophagaceae bacterium]|nr:MAG: endonuclease [Chitinophagaceae bacterium]
MPEGPSIVMAKEAIEIFKGKKIIDAGGYAKLDMAALKGKTVKEIRTWGKHLLVVLSKTLTIRIHFMLFGSYRINERAKANPKLSLTFSNGELNFYVSQIQLINEDLSKVYDWSADVMSPEWNVANTKEKILAHPDRLLCDVLMDQSIFSGVGNIIKNESMYRAGLHPLNTVAAIPKPKITFLVKDIPKYCNLFYKWKKAGTLLAHCNVYKREFCNVCGGEVTIKDGGKSKRRNYYCEHCQQKYD